jgi:hypothetical protein
MAMTKKHYEIVAQTILGECYTSYDVNDPDFCIVDGVDEDTVVSICLALANNFEANDSKFNKAKFLKECGL